MNLLLVGGAGQVGTVMAPYLAAHHNLRVLDVSAPRDSSMAFVQGSVTDPGAVREALAGVDGFIWLAMRDGQGGMRRDQDVATILNNYELNTTGLHLFLFLAQEAEVKRGVYSSSMSVHFRGRDWYPAEELVPFDTPSVYGLTKGIGEHICQYFARWFDMNLIALRITGPRARAEYLAERRLPRQLQDGSFVHVTDEADLARAYLAALDATSVGHGRFDAVFIAGDEAGREHNLSKAERLLGWTPQSHRLLNEE